MNATELIQIIQRAADEGWEKLELQNQAITSIPEELGLLKKLRELHLLGNVLVEVPSVIGELKELRVLSLARNSLEALPPEIGELSQLQELYLDHNRLISLPSTIGQLVNLERLLLDENQLGSLPESFAEMRNLRWVTLDKNHFVDFPLRLCRLKRLRELNLLGNALVEVPSAIGELKELRVLSLARNSLEALPPEIGELSQLQELYLDNNRLISLPSTIGQLVNLERLLLDENQLGSLPESFTEMRNLCWVTLNNNHFVNFPLQLCRLQRLRELHLLGNALVEVPSVIGELKELRVLSLARNSLEALPPEIGELSQLQELYLDNNRLISLPSTIGQLVNLDRLLLDKNQLGSLPESFADIRNLSQVRLNDNQFAEFPLQLCRLPRLQVLSISGNKLTALPVDVGAMRSLRSLHVNSNQLMALPDWIGQLVNLEDLDLSGNQLSALAEAIGQLPQLQWLDLSGNQLNFLPKQLFQLQQLQGLFLHGNVHLGLEDEILGPSFEAVMHQRAQPARPGDILTYYFEKQRTARPLNEVKLLLVGRGTSGKSSIRDRMLFNTFDPNKKETQGVQIDPWQLIFGEGNVLAHVWDFAGQEITHATHRFFLTERSIYLLVLDARADTQDRDAEYWLRLISAFGKDSPVLVALNKSDQKPFDVDRFALRDKYPSIRAFIATDCETRLGIDQLTKEVRAAVEALEAVHHPFPAAWIQLKDRFSKMQENYLPFDAYRELCAKYGETDTTGQERLARILHALGIILHYADDPRLRDTTVLNPRWVTESIYKLLRLKHRPETDGTLTLAEARAALPDEKTEMVTYLIDLMRRFELCFPVDENEERWLVPELLSRFQPPLGNEWLDEQAVRLRYEYKVLPEGLIPRLITRTYPLSADQERWRNGVILTMQSARALVRTDLAASQVNVTIIGKESGRNRLAKLIRNHFQHIHRDVQGLDPKELVEVEKHRDVFKSVKVLEIDEQERNTTTVETDAGSVTINHTLELNRISAPAARDTRQLRLKLFLSYSHKNARLRDVFSENLTLLEAARLDRLVV